MIENTIQSRHLQIDVTDYRTTNRTAYDRLAPAYRERREADRKKDLELIRPFVRLLHQQYRDRVHVLDVGCGNGLNLSMFADEGFAVTGVDVSEKMLDVARSSCPSATLFHADFLDWQVAPQSFHGVFAKAIIHLFPKVDALRVLAKIHQILKPGGVFYVTTTVDLFISEGFRPKIDYPYDVVRFRRSWTREELLSSVEKAGFRVAETGYNEEPDRAKKWFNIWALTDSSLNTQ